MLCPLNINIIFTWMHKLHKWYPGSVWIILAASAIPIGHSSRWINHSSDPIYCPSCRLFIVLTHISVRYSLFSTCSLSQFRVFFNKNGREKEAREIEITLSNQITLKRCRCLGEMWLARGDLKNKTLKFKVDYYKMGRTTDGYWTWTWFWKVKLWFLKLFSIRQNRSKIEEFEKFIWVHVCP